MNDCADPHPPARNRLRFVGGGAGIERAQAHFYGRAFSPHRHDTYAVGITIAGVQTFKYRGELRHCLPGQCHILHPDELHDGAAAGDAGFGYRILYIQPALIQQALQGRPLPFVATPVIDMARLPAVRPAEIWDFAAEIGEAACVDLAVAVADLLARAASPEAPAARGALPLRELARVRDLIAAHPAQRLPMDRLEQAAGLDRWSIARHFRTLFGTSPSRFRTMRQLDLVRRLLGEGMSLAAASVEAGFSDQSHMSRQFKRAYGLTPAAWVAATR